MTRKPGEDGDKRIFQCRNPHFFKVILDESLQSGKLVIPKVFMRKYGAKLTNPIQLKVPSGRVWEVELKRSNDRVWLEKGWLDFARHYSVGFGHFLVFRYEGNSLFHVILFNLTATEIEYPNPVVSENVIKIEPDDDDDAEEEEEEEEEEVNLSAVMEEIKEDKSREPPSLSHHRPSKMMRANSSSETDDSRNAASKDVRATSQAVKLESPEEEKHPDPGDRKQEVKSFRVIISPSYLKKHADVKIPANFVRSHLKHHAGAGVAKLRVGQRTWPVKLIVRVESPKRARAGLYQGWSVFAEENALELGDVCIFELINARPMVFQVSITRHW